MQLLIYILMVISKLAQWISVDLVGSFHLRKSKKSLRIYTVCMSVPCVCHTSHSHRLVQYGCTNICRVQYL